MKNNKLPKKISLFLFAMSIIAISSCKTSITDYTINWTNEIKSKILEDANQPSDSIVKSDSGKFHEYFKNGHKQKEITLADNLKDTVISRWHSADQQFELLREHCPAVNQDFAGIKFGKSFIGWSEFKYCNGKMKATGARFSSVDVGIWTKYDTTGKITETTDHGNSDILNRLKRIKYAR
jgi:antitoxin component YwqK of YwqJK toxin-antitoxin module